MASFSSLGVSGAPGAEDGTTSSYTQISSVIGERPFLRAMKLNCDAESVKLSLILDISYIVSDISNKNIQVEIPGPSYCINRPLLVRSPPV